MARRHSPGCYCCNDCYEIQESDLFCVDPPAGLTQVGGWNGSACCKCLEFTFDDPDFTEQTIFDTGSVSAIATSTHEWLVFYQPPPPWVCGGDCEALVTQGASLCCRSGPSAAATSTSVMSHLHEICTRFRHRRERIGICIKKDTILCGEEEVTKWVVSMQELVFVEWRHGTKAASSHFSRAFENVNECFTINNSPILSECQKCNQDRFLTEVENDCSEVGMGLSELPGNGFQFISFNRVLYFDPEDWPPAPGTLLEFDLDAVPGDCEYKICNGSGTFENTICLGFSSWPTAIIPCWCNAETTCELVEAFRVPLEGLWCSSGPVALFGCDCDPDTPAFGLSCGPFEPFSCGDVALNCLECTETGRIETCFDLYADYCGFYCGEGNFFVLGCGCALSNQCTIETACPATSPCGECCSEWGDCQCASTVQGAYVSMTGYNIERECNWTPASYCVGRVNRVFEVVACT